MGVMFRHRNQILPLCVILGIGFLVGDRSVAEATGAVKWESRSYIRPVAMDQQSSEDVSSLSQPLLFHALKRGDKALRDQSKASGQDALSRALLLIRARRSRSESDGSRSEPAVSRPDGRQRLQPSLASDSQPDMVYRRAARRRPAKVRGQLIQALKRILKPMAHKLLSSLAGQVIGFLSVNNPKSPNTALSKLVDLFRNIMNEVVDSGFNHLSDQMQKARNRKVMTY